MRHPAAQGLRRHVDELDLVGAPHDAVGNRLALLHAGDALDHVVDRLEVLDVERRDHVEARVEQLLDVLPALLVSGARDVRVRQLVDEHDIRASSQHGIDVHLLELRVAVLDLAPRDDLEVAELLSRASPPVGLDDADHHVGAAVVTPATLVEHRKGLAHARGRAQIQTKLAPRHAHSVSYCARNAGISRT